MKSINISSQPIKRHNHTACCLDLSICEGGFRTCLPMYRKIKFSSKVIVLNGRCPINSNSHVMITVSNSLVPGSPNCA